MDSIITSRLSDQELDTVIATLLRERKSRQATKANVPASSSTHYPPGFVAPVVVPREPLPTTNCLFITGFSGKVFDVPTRLALTALLGKYGTVRRIKAGICRDGAISVTVALTDPQEATTVRNATDGVAFCGIHLNVRYARSVPPTW